MNTQKKKSVGQTHFKYASIAHASLLALASLASDAAFAATPCTFDSNTPVTTDLGGASCLFDDSKAGQNLTVTGSGTIGGGVSTGPNTGTGPNGIFSTSGGGITVLGSGVITNSFGAGISLGRSGNSITGDIVLPGANTPPGCILGDPSCLPGMPTTISGTPVPPPTTTALSGSISNAGTISGNGYGIISSISGTGVTTGITNTGVISMLSSSTTSGAGIYVHGVSTISGGITNSGSIIGGVGTVAGSGILVDGRLTGGISNSGRITATSSGSAGIANAGTLTGGISNTGTITASSAGINNAGSLTGNIDNNGTITATGGHAIYISGGTVTGNIVNSGRLVSTSGEDGYGLQIAGSVTGSVTNSGIMTGLRMTSAGSIGGGTITNSGTISQGSGSPYSVSKQSAQSLVINNTGTISGGIADLGQNSTLNMTAGLASSTIMGSSGTTLNISGTVSSISGTVTGATTRITGPIQFVQFLNNTVNINGAFIAENSIATSQLNVNNGGTLYLGSSSGTINLNTATGTFSILSGGTLAVNASDRLVNMSGSTGGPMSNAGTILVGAGQGLTISGGSYTQSVGGTFQTEVASNTSFGKLRLFSGTINLAAGTKIDVLVQPGASLTAGTLLNNVMLASSITGGAFSSFSVSDNSTDYDFEVDYCRTGDTLECNTVGTNLGLRIKAAGALGRTAATRPLVTTGVVQTVFQMLRMGNNVVQAVSSSNSSGGGINTGDVLRDRHGWIKPLYMQSKQDDEGTVSGYKADSYGIIGGMDGTYNEKTRLGVAGSYTSSKVESNRSLATHDANIDAWRLIGYGSYALSPNTEFTFQGDYSTGTIKGSRQIAVGDVASSKYRNETWHFSGALSRVLDVTPGKTTFTPTVRLDYTRSYDHSYTESGGSTNLAVQSNVSEEAIVTIQGKLNHAISSTTTLSVNASAGYDTIGQQSSLTAAALGGGSTFVATGLAPQREVYQLGVGSLTKLAQGGEINVRYDLETRRGYTGQSVSVKYRKPF